MPDLVVAGAGMAGLVAAAEARRAGADVLLLEKSDWPGGSMLLSSGVIWRHREFERFRTECPAGDPALQRILFERLDDDVAWLHSLGVPVAGRYTRNPLTIGARFEAAVLCERLVAHVGVPRLGTPLRSLETIPDGVPLILATGGFQASRELVREHVTLEADALLLRAAGGSTGDGLCLGVEAGGETSGGLDEFYGRNMPAAPGFVGKSDFVELAQLYAHHARVTNVRGERYVARTWSEIDVVQWTAHQPRARAWYRVARERLGERVGERTVGEMVEAAERAGAPVRREPDAVTVETVAGITSTLGGLRIDPRARVAPGVYACGGDVGGIATGGYASGLAAALVFGRIAARAALAV